MSLTPENSSSGWPSFGEHFITPENSSSGWPSFGEHFTAAIILIYAKLLGGFTGWWTTTLPDFSKAEFLPSIIVPGALYYITPFRRWANAPHHKKISESIRQGLVSISGYPDQPERYTWKNLRSLFFTLIDQDESLKQKRSLAYANGAVWSSCADSTVIALIFFLVALAFYFIGLEEAFPAAMIFLIIVAVSIFGSIVCTKRQVEIAIEQLEIIGLKYRTSVEKRLNALDQ
ncbi:hypothetical protein FIU28_15555 [Tardiphaga sp. vice154]|uniref:hypothetical protein n=1 Tax=Tardiphaga sp. vice154 TaxID=2592814 RepID=UPI0011659BA4|nr:hypothetical protein [Tardiphaga sp. vice154]QDM22414.1 hypothetical protein FIU28_15555 [Tardiphaga sp. vice154]